MTLSAALALLLTPVGATPALGLGGFFFDPEVEVSIVSQSKSGVVLDIRGTDYSGRRPGIEIALNPVGYYGSGTRNTFVTSVLYNPDNPDAWTYQFTLDAAQVAQLDPGTSYQIMTMRGGGRDIYDNSGSAHANVPFDFDALTEPESSPTPEEPSTGTGSGSGSGSGAGSGTGSGSGADSGSGSAGSGTSSGRAGGGDSGDGRGRGSEENPEKKEPKKPWSAPEEPPTAKGLELTGLGEASVDADEVIHAEASGFEPNETGIKVVVYSTPLVLATDVKANGRGVAKWSGRLPKDIGLGKHTLTFQGSVDRGIRFVVTGTPSDGECVQSGCAPATAAVEKAAPVGDGGVGLLTWIIVAAMIVLALTASAVALLAGRRRRDQEWDDPTFAQGPPRYPPDPHQASEPYPAHPPHQLRPQPRYQLQRQPQRQPGDEIPLPRRLPADQQPAERPQGPRRAGPRRPEPEPLQSGPRRPSHRQPPPQHLDPQPLAAMQPARRQPRPPESFAPPSQRPGQAYEGQRVAGR